MTEICRPWAPSSRYIIYMLDAIAAQLASDATSDAAAVAPPTTPADTTPPAQPTA